MGCVAGEENPARAELLCYRRPHPPGKHTADVDLDVIAADKGTHDGLTPLRWVVLRRLLLGVIGEEQVPSLGTV